MIKQFVFLILFVFSITLLSCQESKTKIIYRNEPNELIGIDFKEHTSFSLKDKCSPYVLYKKQSETDSISTYIYLSNGSCNDAAYEIEVNKKTNKICAIKIKSMA